MILSPNFSQLLQTAYSLCVTNICIISVTGIIIRHVLYLFLQLDKSCPFLPGSSHPAKVYKRFGHKLKLKKITQTSHFAHPSPKGGGVKTATFWLDLCTPVAFDALWFRNEARYQISETFPVSADRSSF